MKNIEIYIYIYTEREREREREREKERERERERLLNEKREMKHVQAFQQKFQRQCRRSKHGIGKTKRFT